MKILMTGGSGLLGTELLKQLAEVKYFDGKMTVFHPTHNELDITDYNQVKKAMDKQRPDVTVHLAEYTDVGLAESEKKECYKTNVIGTQNMARFAKHFIYLSTEYVFDGERGNYQEDDIPNPVNFYSLTKLLGEFEAKRAQRCTIIRTLFKPRPFKHQFVPTDMWTSGRYVNQIAKELTFALAHIEKLPKVLHIGFERVNLFNLAKETRDDLISTKRSAFPIRLPKDTSLNTYLWRKFKNEYKD